MKAYRKLLILAALALSLLVLAACSAEQVLDDIGDQIAANPAETAQAPAPATPAPVQQDAETPAQDAAAETATPADAAPAPTAEPVQTEEPATASDAQSAAAPQVPDEASAVTDYTKLSVDACIEDVGNEPGQLPHIALDCPGAASINEDIDGTFSYLLNEDYCSLYYRAAKGADRILSVLVVQQYDTGDAYFTPYSLDLSTGERIGGEQILSILGIDGRTLADDELSIMAREFEDNYGGLNEGDSAAFYEEQYERTTSPDNADLNRIYFSDGGALFFVAKIYSLAGAEYYEYPMDTGLRF